MVTPAMPRYPGPDTWPVIVTLYSIHCPAPATPALAPCTLLILLSFNGETLVRKNSLKGILFNNLHIYIFIYNVNQYESNVYLFQSSSLSPVTMVSDSGRVWSVSDSGCDLSLMSIIDPVSSGSGREANTWYSYTVPNMPPAADAGSKDDRRKWRLAGIFLSQMMMGSKQPSKCSLTQNLSLVSFYLK